MDDEITEKMDRLTKLLEKARSLSVHVSNATVREVDAINARRDTQAAHQDVVNEIAALTRELSTDQRVGALESAPE